MRWAASPAFQERLGQVRADFLIMSDDDVYVDMRELASAMAVGDIPRDRYYAGEVLEEQLGHVFLPNRDPSHRHYLSEATYPDGVLPPLALGNFYVLSMDLVRFIAGSAIHPVSRCGYNDFQSQSIIDAMADLPYHRERFIHSLTAIANIKKVAYFHRLHEVMLQRSQYGVGWHSKVLALLREITDDVEQGQGVFSNLTAWDSSPGPVVEAVREPDPVVEPAVSIVKKEFARIRDVIKVCVYLPQLIWTPVVEMFVRWSDALSKEDEEELGQVCSTSSATLSLEKCENKQLPYIELEFFTDSLVTSEIFLDRVRVAHTHITYVDIADLGQVDSSSVLTALLSSADFIIIVVAADQTDSSAAGMMRRIAGAAQEMPQKRDRVLLLLPHGQMSTMLRTLQVAADATTAVYILPAAYVVRAPNMSELVDLVTDSDLHDRDDLVHISRDSPFLSALMRLYHHHHLDHRWPTLFSSPSLIDAEAVSWHRFPLPYNAADNADVAMALSSATAVRYLLHSINSQSESSTASDDLPMHALHSTMQSVRAVSSSSSLLFIGSNSLHALSLVMQLLRKVMHSPPIPADHPHPHPHPHPPMACALETMEIILSAASSGGEGEDRGGEIMYGSRTPTNSHHLLSEGDPSQVRLLALTALDCAEFNHEVRSFTWSNESSALVRVLTDLVQPSHTILLSGEPIIFSSDISLDTLRIDILFTTTRQPNLDSSKVRVEYFPVFSSSFAEMASIEPGALLAERGTEWAEMVTRQKTRGTALTRHFQSDINRVEALGRCRSGRPTPENAHTPTLEEPNTRFHRRYLEDAIAIYKNFKFVIAYEHEIVPGYITEKLTNAFLAAAVPIYIGAGDVTRFFNPNAMVICSKEDVRVPLPGPQRASASSIGRPSLLGTTRPKTQTQVLKHCGTSDKA
eukprot:gene31530-40944_t